jgi:type IV pilus assembly protein PilA
MRQVSCGFTLIELMIVVAIMGVLATLAIPSYQDRVIRSQVTEGLQLAEFAKQAIAEHYAKTRNLPPNNQVAGLPPGDRIVGNYVTSLVVKSGAVHVQFGNLSNRNLTGKTLTLRPAVVVDYPQVPIAWVCGTANVPGKMKVQSENATDLPSQHLPLDCRGQP